MAEVRVTVGARITFRADIGLGLKESIQGYGLG